MSAHRVSGPGEARLPMRDFSHSLPMALLRTREVVMQVFRPMLRRHALTEQQWRVLRALAEEDALSATEVARRTLMLSPSLSRILRHLVARGLVRRRTPASDQRQARLSITVAGRRLFGIVARESEDRYGELAAALDPERLASLYRQLEELRRAAQAAVGALTIRSAAAARSSRPSPPAAR